MNVTKNIIRFKNVHILINIVILGIVVGSSNSALTANRLTKKLYENMVSSFDSTHYIIITSKQLLPPSTGMLGSENRKEFPQSSSMYNKLIYNLNTTQILDFLSSYQNFQVPLSHGSSQSVPVSISVFYCSPTQSREYCQLNMPIYMYYNTIKIQYNGKDYLKQLKDDYIGTGTKLQYLERRQDKFQLFVKDVKKWLKFRIEQMPIRFHTLSEVSEYIKDKAQIFCYIDSEGARPTHKELVFMATSKQMHFLQFCHLDQSIVKDLGMKQGHVVMIRPSMSWTVDFYSSNIDAEEEENIQEQLQEMKIVHRVWLNFMIHSFQNELRIEGRNKSHDNVAILCDFSLQCEEELKDLFKYELFWRKKHPDLNFKLKMMPGTDGEIKIDRDIIHDYPIIKFGKRRVEKKIVSKKGTLLQQTMYISDVFKQTNVVINQQTIQKLLKDYQQKKLKSVITDTEIDYRLLQQDEAEKYRQKEKKYYRQGNRKKIDEINRKQQSQDL